MNKTSFPFRRLLVMLTVVALVLPTMMVPRPTGAVPVAPVLVSPPDDPYGINPTTAVNYPPTGTPTLVWAAVSGATKYYVEVCPNNTCSSRTQWADVYATQWTPPEALLDGAWYWRVRACDKDGCGAFSAIWSFTKSWLTGVPWDLQRPGVDEVVEFFEYPIFSWDPVVGAAYYRLQIFQAPCSGSTVLNLDVMKPTYTPTERLSRGEYYWWVIPFNNRGYAGTPSACRHFTMDYSQRPTLLAPADGSIQSLSPEFRWTAVKGAREYKFQYSTNQDFTDYTEVTTKNTRYTPLETFANDTEYYWRVAAVDSIGTLGPWSPNGSDPDPYRSFVMAWHLTPRLLSPTDNFISAAFPVFRWTPVAGAKSYHIQISANPSFSPIKAESFPVDPRYTHTNWGTICHDPPNPCGWYWRVRAKDSSDHWGPWTDPPHAFAFAWSDVGQGTPAPTLIYPPYYYDPLTEPSTQPLGVAYDPMVPVPVFQWDRVVHHMAVNTEVVADEYIIEVDDSPAFSSIDWTASTENLSIAPSLENGFGLGAGTYYWRVRAYREGAPMSNYSEPWLFRFDPSRQNYRTPITPYFPTEAAGNAMDSVYDTPLFGWSPIVGAHHYDFQLATTAAFTEVVHAGQPLYSFYTPQVRLPPDTYFWRVQAQDAAHSPLSPWTTPQRVVIAYPLRWDDPSYMPLAHPISQEPEYTRIGFDTQAPPGGAAYDLAGLYLARDAGYWYLALDMPPTNTVDMYFAFYVDLDHGDDSGGNTDPKGFNVYADRLARPEVALYAHHDSTGAIDAVTFYRWYGTSWGVEQSLLDVGGNWSYVQGHSLELKIPLNILITDLGTVSVQAYSAAAGGQAQDTVPSEPTLPRSYLGNPVGASDKLNPLHPWDNPLSNPFIHSENPPLSFAKPLPWSYIQGYAIEMATDYAFTVPIQGASGEWMSTTPTQYWFLGTRWTWTQTFPETDSLFWRIRVKHSNSAGWGPYSQPVRFTKVNYVPTNMVAEYDYAPPTFRWDRVEGANQYQLQVDDDPGFSSVNLQASTKNPSYTPLDTLANKTWYWRLRIKDGSDRWGNWASGGSFIKYARIAELTSPVGGALVIGMPTFVWQSLLYPLPSPVMGAVRYNLLVDNDNVFQPPYVLEVKNIDTVSYTPVGTGLRMDEGTYYWKVAALDAMNGNGEYSAPQQFYKALLAPQPLYARMEPFLELAWQPVEGAAYYRVQICADPYYTRQCDTFSTDQTHYAATTAERPGDYYWRVCMCDKAGACGPYHQGRLRWSVFLPLAAKHKVLNK